MHSPTPAGARPALTFDIAPPDASLAEALRNKIDRKTKPLGALGRLEALALQLGLVQQTLAPQLNKPHILVCAGDHGAANAGISAYPQEVTWQMVENFLAGGAAINVFARANGIGLVVADAGVNHDFGPRENLVDAKVGLRGTANYLEGPAMSAEQCDLAMLRGAQIVADIHARGCNVVGFGEMGIGNTASASLITHFLAGIPLEDCVGRGTGLDDAGVARKLELLRQAAALYRGDHTPLSVLAQVGGFEIARLAGGMLAAAERKMLLLIDGFIVTSALLVAATLHPATLQYCVFSHRSQERGHRLQLEHLGARPLLDMDLRLGEGTGAALAWPLVRAACTFLNEMASFESAGVSEHLAPSPPESGERVGERG
ncbi:MAG: nicotinate-nucleotide--dimethylbenzimidazole phosphoribosyltransferase [Rhodocyclaceae bacterium]|nr:nicotinate-nucleotide--dimethylbenzimidazole phosphoribosyltransferase [Rhodocyclaceae bacterium]